MAKALKVSELIRCVTLAAEISDHAPPGEAVAAFPMILRELLDNEYVDDRGDGNG